MRHRTPARLATAYRGTIYGVGRVGVRIGAAAPALDALLDPHGARGAAFVTAWNPFSRRMPEGWNERMLGRLREAARRWVIGEGWGTGRRWRERHLLVVGDPRRLRALARRFRQTAIVVVAPRRSARLVWCGPPDGGCGA
jgi:hypothetical protein